MNKEHLHSEGRPYTKEEFVEKIKTDKKFAERFGNLGKIYGYQWRNWNGEIDQISDLIKQLKESPDSRRLLVSSWNPSDLPHQVLPPCHYGFQVYTRELSKNERMDYWFENNKPNRDVCDSVDESSEEEQHKYFDSANIPKRTISLMFNMRSVDTFLGLPFNIASYGLLLEIIAKAVNMIPDELIGNLGDVHLYSNHIEQAKEQLTRQPELLPTLNINTEWWPTEGGECGIGPIDAVAVFNAFNDNNFCRCLLEEDLQLSNYQSHPAIKAPLSN